MKKFHILLFFIVCFLSLNFSLQAQDEEKILYYQMEPLDDSLFIQIQTEVFIDPPDPKAEIIVDLRDPNNQTVTIKGNLYPFLAFSPQLRARIITYPFKINMEEGVKFTSVFTRVIEKIKLGKVIEPPSVTQISSTLHYINPFLQLFGGERFGIPIKKDIGISFGIGTKYSGVLETNMVEANFHILGFYGGAFGPVDELIQIKDKNNHNNLFFTAGYQVGYVLPFGNFLEFSYMKVTDKPSKSQKEYFSQWDTLGFHAKIVDKDYVNWEFRYPLRVLGSTRAKFYFGQYLDEWHVGFEGRELSLAGSTFDFRFDAVPHSDVRQPQYVVDILVQKIAESWAFSSFAIGPSVVFSKDNRNHFGVISIFVNLRLKVGTSL